MKKLITLLFLMSVVFAVFYSCNKTTNEEIIIQKDTLFIRDSIQVNDTLFVYDTIIFNDTIVQIDTIIVEDTSEFDYLFKHYELGKYEVLFYTINKQKDPYQICRMYSDDNTIDIIKQGSQVYPIWSPDPSKIIYIDLGNLAIIEEDINTGEAAILYSFNKNIMFLRYFNAEEKFLVSYLDGDKGRIAAIDYKTNSFIELTNYNDDERNPTCSEVDDWIYFCKKNRETYDIYRKKIDESLVEEVYIEPEFNLTSFSISADGKFLITPKFIDDKGVVVFYDIERQRIIHELKLPVDGYPIYATLSRDNKAIFFVNGTRYNFSEPRNIYRMALDKTQLFKMTEFEDHLAIRPLVK